MGLLDKFRSTKTKPPVPRMPLLQSSLLVELPPEVLAAVAECHRTARDVGVATRGKGSALSVTIAGTYRRQEAMHYVSTLERGPAEKTVAAVVLRDPTNAFDPDAVRVLVEGVQVGFLPRNDAASWQPVLQECERRGVLLVGSVGLRPPNTQGELSAVIGLRDGLTGFAGQVSSNRAVARAAANVVKDARRAADLAKAEARAAAARPMTDTERDEVIQTLTRLSNEDSVRTKTKATVVVKQLRQLFPLLRAHVDAAEAAAGGDKNLPISVSFSDVEDAADELLDDPEDADDREDRHDQLTGTIDDLLQALSTSQPTTLG